MKRIGLIKLGGTTISAGKSTESDGYEQTGSLIVRKLKEYKKLVCVVSAYAGVTDRLIQRAKNVASDPDWRALDLLLATGEIDSASMLGIFLRSRGIDCEVLTGWQAGIHTNSHYGKASITSVDTDVIRAKLIDSRVVIVTGFQGVSPSNDVATLGRGGSDTSAIALAIALKVPYCEIITDVDGIFTANPKIVDKAKLISDIDYEIAMELSSSGAKVIDARAVELAKRHNYSFSIRHFREESPSGTRVSSKKNGVIGVSLNRHCSSVSVLDMPNRPGSLHRMAGIISQHKVNIGYMYQPIYDRELATCTALLWESDARILGDISMAIQSAFEGCEVITDDASAAVSLVGRAIMDAPGTMLLALKSVRDSGALVSGISTSSSRITFVIGKAHAEEALTSLHRNFVEDV